MLVVGMIVIPIGIYVVGGVVFGEFAGAGFGAFYRAIQSDLRDGQMVVIFLIFSPYLVWQAVRLSFKLFFRLAPDRISRVSADSDSRR